MGKLYVFILFLFIGNSCFSQLTVKPASPAKSNYIYVKEKVFYVHGPIALYKNSAPRNRPARKLVFGIDMLYAPETKTKRCRAGSLMFNIPSSPVVSVSLFDFSGKEIFSRKTSEKEDFHSFATGHLYNSVYLVRVLHRDGTVKTSKISVLNYN
ncbi:hypothetical protein GCM10007103_34250 [Salinimicrobium marinum]|uniref:Por secretion system C-terminal sorting domain-containing protein n=1 Tax=Salinimicrobium marinum TaxID=680283 RepID=A0A918SND3_9FLAO|nr:T9SS type A sorting domain-containing protein [Salinimicrobium marinum]GHA50606.1 hypothetical protein GCM10007103_34250 [Salinimicrobium marinum]